MKNKTIFLDDREKLEHYAGISRVDLGQYKNAFEVKVYEGAEILIYHYDESGRMVIDTILLCTDITANDKGIRITVVDKKDYRVVRIGEVPNKFNRLPIITHAPYTVKVERTLKRMGDGKILQGLAGYLCFRTKSVPQKRVPGHLQAILYSSARWALPEGDLEDALQRLEG